MSTIAVVLAAIVATVITAGADTLIKRASLMPGFSGWQPLMWAAVIYVATALLWFFLLRYMKLFTLNIIYSVSMVIALSAVSVFYFRERVNAIEVTGMVMATAGMVLLLVFAER